MQVSSRPAPQQKSIAEKLSSVTDFLYNLLKQVELLRANTEKVCHAAAGFLQYLPKCTIKSFGSICRKKPTRQDSATLSAALGIFAHSLTSKTLPFKKHCGPWTSPRLLRPARASRSWKVRLLSFSTASVATLMIMHACHRPRRIRVISDRADG